MSELFEWIQQSVSYVIATSGVATLCLLAMRAFT